MEQKDRMISWIFKALQEYFTAQVQKRICPGRHFAEANLWIAIASILASFTISKAIGEDGKEITPEINLCCGLTRQAAFVYSQPAHVIDFTVSVTANLVPSHVVSDPATIRRRG
ncbi:hypothetical protein H0H81_000309 [Sphagnurus paluster]|uniref:Uncharacterized protein n=1 Tax=Sphagnurus paluster TaxID=117069 RepID=A0A9P7GKH7_9AGAR|nr:hypothetical protein H0H81_000309 [Sphagnurus paluster]